jgi:hypothetical protein
MVIRDRQAKKSEVNRGRGSLREAKEEAKRRWKKQAGRGASLRSVC